LRTTDSPASRMQIGGDNRRAHSALRTRIQRHFEFRIPLGWLGASVHATNSAGNGRGARSLRLRVSLWSNRLPVDSLPLKGWLDLPLLEEQELMSLA